MTPPLGTKNGGAMSKMKQVRIGHKVSDFEINAYDPVDHDFKKFSLKEQKNSGKWSILFFYPADFTFV